MIFAIFSIIDYAGALLWVVPTLVNLENQTSKQTQPNIKAVFSIGLVAVVCHFASLTTNFILEGGSQNYSLANANALMSFFLSAFATLALPRLKTIWFPLMVVYTFAICSIVLTLFTTGNFIRNLAQNSGLVFLALLYALQIKWLDKKLKSKKFIFCQLLPPLMTVERHFFTLTVAAQALLTVTLISGIIYLHNFFAPEQVHKAVFSFVAWIMYSVLILGQWKWRWRGNRVLIYSISGMILLTVGYFGSHLIK